MMTLLSVEMLNVFYGNVRVLWDVSLSVEEHEIVTLIGANGAGKTTLLMSISGILKARTGLIKFEGIPIEKAEPHDVVKLGIAHVAQERHLFPQMSVEENLLLGSRAAKNPSTADETLAEVYEYFEALRPRRAQRAGSLSGGEQKMLAFGRALMSRPKLLLLDEPSAGLAPIMVKELARVIRRLRDVTRLTTLIVEQNAVLALGLAQRGYLLESGRVVAHGSTAELAGSEKVRIAYLGM
jgi:branched-chain amino acid transport system ATP-binding protein